MNRPIDRRRFFSFASAGIGSVALSSLLLRDGTLRAAAVKGEADDPPPHHPPRADKVIHITLTGGLSQVDSFDYKPELEKQHGMPLGGDEKPDVFFGKVGLLRKSDWTFRQRGESGLWISDLFPHLAECADELTLIRSMFAETSNHTPATFQENTGFRLNGFPVFGAWTSYVLGSETDNLPAFIVIPDSRGLPAGGSINWSNGFLPARYQGVIMRSKGTPIDDLFPARPIKPETERDSLNLLAALNRRHLQVRGGNDLFSARIRSYELAAKMQLAVPEVANLDGETKATHEMYGLAGKETADFGRSCLLTRRLLERGVRFVNIIYASWDHHSNLDNGLSYNTSVVDQPIAALMHDLKQRGLLDSTMVVWGGEFGRTPLGENRVGQPGVGAGPAFPRRDRRQGAVSDR